MQRSRVNELLERALDLVAGFGQPGLVARLDHYLEVASPLPSDSCQADEVGLALDLLREALDGDAHHRPVEELARGCLCLTRDRAARLGQSSAHAEDYAPRLGEYLKGITCAETPISWALATRDLADMFLKRPRGEAGQNRDAAIRLYCQALQSVTKESNPIEWADICSSLATAYYERVTGDRATNLEWAIHYDEQALTVRTRDAMSVKWAATASNLALSYFWRLKGERADNIEKSLLLLSEIVEGISSQETPAEWADIVQNLATCYVFRLRGQRAENLTRAIEILEQAESLSLEDSAPNTWAAIRVNLATAYRHTEAANKSDLIERSIRLLEQALRVRTREAMPEEWASACVNLAAAYDDRAEGDRAANIDRAIDLYTNALDVITLEAMPQEWVLVSLNLALEHEQRAILRGNDFSAALNIYEEVVRSVSFEGYAQYVGIAQKRRGTLLASLGRWDEARSALEAAAAAVDDQYHSSSNVESRRLVLEQARDAPALAAFAIAQDGDNADSALLKRAALFLDTNRARWLSEKLALSRDRPRTTPASIWLSFEQARDSVRQADTKMRQANRSYGPREYLQLAECGRIARTSLRRAIEDVRGYSAEFMPQADADDVDAASQITALVYLVPTRFGGMAVVVHHGRAYRLLFPTLSDSVLRGRLYGTSGVAHGLGYWNAYRSYLDTSSIGARQIWFEALSTLLVWLATEVMEPISKSLLGLGISTATLIPTRMLGHLPLHAAVVGSPITWCYAPNARSIREAHRAASLVAWPPNALIVANPDATLTHADAEAASVIHVLQNSHAVVLQGPEATLDRVVQSLPEAGLWHFAAHGRLDTHDEMDSKIVLASGTHLSLRSVLELDVSARLAVLSACDVGMIGAELPDEVISFPTGLMHAGAAGVISSIWAAGDLSAAILMAVFYDCWQRQELNPPAALSAAQGWLRCATSHEIARYLYGKGEEWTETTALFMLAPRGACPFAHPFHWAGFYYTGV